MENKTDKSIDSYFKNCLYFTANSLARSLTRLAEQEFGKINMSPSQGFLLMLAVEKPGISQKELGEQMNLAQSTVSRFADSLVRENMLEKKQEGKLALVYPTPKAKEEIEKVHTAWQKVYEEYSKVLGKDAGEKLTIETRRAFELLDSE